MVVRHDVGPPTINVWPAVSNKLGYYRVFDKWTNVDVKHSGMPKAAISQLIPVTIRRTFEQRLWLHEAKFPRLASALSNCQGDIIQLQKKHAAKCGFLTISTARCEVHNTYWHTF